MYVPKYPGYGTASSPVPAVATTASGMIAYYTNPYQNVISAAGCPLSSSFYGNAYAAGSGGMGSPALR